MIELDLLLADDWARWRELRLLALADAPYAFGARLEDWHLLGWPVAFLARKRQSRS